jgi:conjugative transposon TraK protein
MEFKSLNNIDSSFKSIRMFCIIYTVVCTGLTAYCSYSAYDFAEKQREKIYVLDEGKSLMLALSQDISLNRPAELKEHIKRFHELFFTYAPDKEAIENNVKKALFLADKTAFDYYQDLTEKGFYNRVIASNINQVIRIDSIACRFDSYPYEVITYAKQRIIRPSNITERSLVTKCEIINTLRSDNNPQGAMIERFEVVENKNLQLLER